MIYTVSQKSWYSLLNTHLVPNSAALGVCRHPVLSRKRRDLGVLAQV